MTTVHTQLQHLDPTKSASAIASATLELEG